LAATAAKDQLKTKSVLPGTADEIVTLILKSVKKSTAAAIGAELVRLQQVQHQA
jgi:hypothetical protein